jgi:acyl-coenzyme A synthetase/AMP-(fatty) acid ligase
MIAEFSVANFRSFKEKRTFSLISTKDKELSDSNAFELDKKLRLLKSAVIYGANASGKSNFTDTYPLTPSGKIQKYLLRDIGAQKVQELGIGT